MAAQLSGRQNKRSQATLEVVGHGVSRLGRRGLGRLVLVYPLLLLLACEPSSDGTQLPQLKGRAVAKAQASSSSARAAGASEARPKDAATGDAAGPKASTQSRRSPSAAERATLVFGGDVSLGLGVGINIKKLKEGHPVPEGVAADYPFGGVKEVLQEADLAVVNLECVCSPLGRVATGHNPFRCPLRTPEVLRTAGIDLVGVANNHVMDFGPKAFRDMLRRLDKGKLKHFGAESVMWRSPQPVTIRRLKGVRIGLLAYYWPPKKPLRDVLAARAQVDFLIVFAHWGQEGKAEPLLLQRMLARDFVDAGVDLVVGTHAHVVQPVEWYRGKLVAYGLGNMVFDGMNHTESHRHGQLLELKIGKQLKPHYAFHDVVLDEEGQPKLKRSHVPVRPAPPTPLSAPLVAP